MIFQGDLTKYHPADALMFLSQLSLNGILSVAQEAQILTLAFKGGMLLDGQSAKGDDKIIRMLRFAKRIDAALENRIRQIRNETGMPVRQILGELKLFPLSEIREILEIGLQEALLELFLLESGTFNFTDTPVDPDESGIKMDAGAASIRVLSHADEMRDFAKSVITLERGIVLQRRELPEALCAAERTLAVLASKPIRLRALISAAPWGSHQVMQIIEKLLAQEVLALLPVPADAPVQAAPAGPTAVDPVFSAYKRALKMLIRAEDILKKIEAVISFCKNYYPHILIFTAREGIVAHCKAVTIAADGAIAQHSLKSDFGALDQDPVFQAVHRAGIGFFGAVFPSPLIAKVITLPSAGECALLPVLNKPPLSMFFYVCTESRYTGLSPHHYLELLSWMMAPAGVGAGAGAPLTVPPPLAAQGLFADNGLSGAAPGRLDIAALVGKVEDLPPLPALVSKTLQLLSDPEANMKNIEKVIAQDQALVAKMIKVSNSALYGGLQKVGTLRQALTRLGAKTTKSLILTTSTRSYFLKDRKGVKNWGESLWQHSVECGFAAQRVAVAGHYIDPDQAFIAGIMHDIGKLVLLILDDATYKEIQKVKAAQKTTDQAAEIAVIGSDHAELGRLFMEKWNLPEPVRACTQFHHRPEQAGNYTLLATMVAYANYLSHTLGQRAQSSAEEDALAAQWLQTLGIDAPTHTVLLEQVRADFQNTDLME